MSQSFGVYPALSMRAAYAPPNRRWRMVLTALVEKLKRRSKDDFKRRHFEASLILQAVSWYLRCPLSYRDLKELFRERGLSFEDVALLDWTTAAIRQDKRKDYGKDKRKDYGKDKRKDYGKDRFQALV